MGIKKASVDFISDKSCFSTVRVVLKGNKYQPIPPVPTPTPGEEFKPEVTEDTVQAKTASEITAIPAEVAATSDILVTSADALNAFTTETSSAANTTFYQNITI